MLKGWDAICAYTGYSKDTIRRWMKKRGFPVLPGFGPRPPITSKSLIDIWLIKSIDHEKGKKK